jgi:spermidine/putrescine transport system ATP-binding protein
MIAGFEEPTGGRIMLDGNDVTYVSPRRRKVNMVFQDYALFPHMSVGRNVAFGLRMRGMPKRQRLARAQDMLQIVGLDQAFDKKPHQLSGGQRQRVALARALVVEPAVLLLDEPLGALDLKLRQAMQLELKRIQREVGITFVYVTHDQGEALTMSDRIAVMNTGHVEQLGTPREVYEAPTTRFVADFIGTSNVISAAATHVGADEAEVDGGPDGRIVVPLRGARPVGDLCITVRPEKITLAHDQRDVPETACRVRGRS